MNIQQLRYLCHIVDGKFNMSDAAQSLHTSQSGISKQISLLEGEVGTDLFVRSRGRLIGLTQEGMEVLPIARRILKEIDNIRSVGRASPAEQVGKLIIATTHIHARHLLLPVLGSFKEAFPRIHIELKLGNPTELIRHVSNGDVDISICTRPTARSHPSDLVAFPLYRFLHSIVVPQHHELLAHPGVTLHDVARYPFISIDDSYVCSSSIAAAFELTGIRPETVLCAPDADVIKAYVAAGLGITVLPDIVIERGTDTTLRTIPASHLFEPSVSYAWIHRYTHLSKKLSTFISLLTPHWNHETLLSQLTQGDTSDDSMALTVGEQ